MKKPNLRKNKNNSIGHTHRFVAVLSLVRVMPFDRAG